MKEVLFRGKTPSEFTIDKEYNCLEVNDIWVYGNLIHESSIDPISKVKIEYYGIKENDSYCEVARQYPVKDYTIGQYTGIKDIHLNKIFEGDVVRSSNFVQGVVVYLEAVGAYIVSTEPPEVITTDENWNSDMDWIFICDCRDLEVVGNIVDGIFIHPKTNIEDISDLDSKGLNDILAEEDSNENNNN